MIRHLLRLVWKRKRANALLTIEIFFSFLVLFGVTTLGGAMIMRYRRPLGFDYRDCWVINMQFQDDPASAVEHRQMIDSMLRELHSMPEIEAASATSIVPLAWDTWTAGAKYEGRRVEVRRSGVTDDFANVMRVKVLEGRWFSREDDSAAKPPLVIDADLARQLARNGSVVGHQLTVGGEAHTIVGVIAPFRMDGEFSKDHVDVAFDRLTSAMSPEHSPHDLVVRVRTGTPADFEPVFVKRLHAVAPGYPMRVIHMEQMHRTLIRLYLIPAIAAAVVAAFLILMVFLGLSGVLWQNVTRRAREIGLRRALGATSSVVYRQILIEVALLCTLAVGVGLVIIAQLPVIGLFRVVTPAAYAIGIAASLATIYALTLLCGLYPGWLAGRVQPAEALHYE